MENAIANGETAGESKGAHQAPEKDNDLTAGGHELPRDWLFVACVGVLAIACAWFNAPLMTLLQKGIPDDKLGRVMGLFTAMNGLAIPIGTALGGAIAEVTGTPMFFTIDGAFMLALGAGIALSKSVRQLY